MSDLQQQFIEHQMQCDGERITDRELILFVEVPQSEREHLMHDIAETYAVVRFGDDKGSIIIYGLYRGREWHSNVSGRWLVDHHLSRIAELETVVKRLPVDAEGNHVFIDDRRWAYATTGTGVKLLEGGVQWHPTGGWIVGFGIRAAWEPVSESYSTEAAAIAAREEENDA